MIIPHSAFRAFIPFPALAAAFLCASPRAEALDYYWAGPAEDGGDGNWNTTQANWYAAGGGGIPTTWANGNVAVFGLHSHPIVRVTLTQNIAVPTMSVDGGPYVFRSAAGITLNADSITPPFGGGVAFNGNLEVVADNPYVFFGNFGDVYFEENARLTASAANAIANIKLEVSNNANVLLTATEAFSGGQALFFDNSALLANEMRSLTGGSLNFFGNSRLSAGSTFAVDGADITLYGDSWIGVYAANALTANTGVTFGNAGSSRGGLIRLEGNSTTLGRVTAASGSAGVIENGATPNATITIGNGLDSSSFAGQMRDGGTGGSLALRKTGSTTLTLTGANTYTGGTIISGGTLLANNTTGSATGTGTVAVQNGGTLGGSGAIAGPVNVQSGGAIAPGNSSGVLTFGGDVAFEADSLYEFELGAPTDILTGGVAGIDWDLLSFTGSASLAFQPDSELALSFIGLPDPDTFDAFWDGVTDRSWLIADLDTGTLNYSGLTITNPDWTTGSFSLRNESNDLYLRFTARLVPEPAALSLLLVSTFPLLRRRRSAARPSSQRA